jgi:hypothetical protein
MAIVRADDEAFFSEDTYKDFVKERALYHNERYRDKDETIFEAALSKEADFTKHPEGEEILKAIRSFN